MLPELWRAAKRQLHNEYRHEMARHDGTRLASISRTWRSLVPGFRTVDALNPGSKAAGLHPIPDSRRDVKRVFYQPFFNREDVHVWTDFKSLLCRCYGVDGPVSFLRLSKERGLTYRIGVDASDAPGMPQWLQSHFRRMYLSRDECLPAFPEWLSKGRHSLRLGFFDLRPAGSAFGRLRIPEKGTPSPLAAVDLALSEAWPRGWGCVEVLFQPEHVGIKNAMRSYLALAEAGVRLGVEGHATTSIGHDMNIMHGLKSKLNDDDPIFFVAIRCLVAAEASEFDSIVGAVTAPFRSLSYGDAGLSCLTHDDYRQALGADVPFFELIGSGRSLAPGFPLSASELSVLCHFSDDMIGDERYRLDRVWGTDYAPQDQSQGLYIGDNVYGKKVTPVIQSEALRALHLSVTGATGMGKTTMLLNLALRILEGGQCP